MAKKPYTLFLDQTTIEKFETVAGSSHLDPKHYAALWVSRVSDLKSEHALDALTSIPREYFKARPGRPTSTLNATNSDIAPA